MKYGSRLSGWVLTIAFALALSIPVRLLAAMPTNAGWFIGCCLAQVADQYDGDLRTWRELDQLGGVSVKINSGVSIDYVKRVPQDDPVAEVKFCRAADAKAEFPREPFTRASIGTAWPIASGYVVTNNHVVSESKRVILISVHGQEIPAWAVIRDEATDIALLEVSDPGKLPPALPLSSSQARLGTPVFTIGFPRLDVMGKTPKLSEGVISGMNGLCDDPGSYQTTVPIQPGNSGGPLLNMKGEVVGVVKSMVGVRDEIHGNIYMLQNASLVLKIEQVKGLLDLLPQQESVINALPSHCDTLETLAARVQGSVLIVVAH